jgi:hypothetical protein
MMRGRMVVFASWALLACGCGEKGEHPEAVPFDQVPAELKAVAAKTLPAVKFDSAWKVKFKGQDAYEIRGKETGGKIREVEVSTSGQVLETE